MPTYHLPSQRAPQGKEGAFATVLETCQMQPFLSVTFPWPPSALSPNARQHWTSLAKAKKSYRAACYLTAVAQGATPVVAAGLHVHLQFAPPTRRKYDLDNLLARMKSGLDGLSDAIGVDDSRWQISLSRAEPLAPGFVHITVSAQEPS